jgi:hypothetical protein
MNLSSTPAVKPILDARQWQALQQTLNQARSLKQHLLDTGYVAEDLDVKPATAKPVDLKPAEAKR